MNALFPLDRHQGLKVILSYIVVILMVGVGGCHPRRTTPEPTFTQATARLQEILKEENIEAKIIPLKNTLWIYVPLEEDLFVLKAKVRQPIDPIARRQEKFALQYLDVNFKEGWFIIDYDIADQRLYPKEMGYTNAYSAEYQSVQRRLFQALYRAYGGLKATPVEQSWTVGRAKASKQSSPPSSKKNQIDPKDADDPPQRFQSKGLTITIRSISKDDWFKDIADDSEPTDGDTTQSLPSSTEQASQTDESRLPDFIIIVITDIRTGIELRTTINAMDLKRTLTDLGFQEEYRRRLIMETPQGYLNAIGDKTGEHLDVHEMTWPEFLSRQIEHRIRYKYQYSAFPPQEGNHAKTIEGIVAEAVRAYGFDDFIGVELNDLATGIKQTIPKETLLKANNSNDRPR